MERSEFLVHLTEACERLLWRLDAHADTRCSHNLRFRLLLNRSYDRTADSEFETLYPEDSSDPIRNCDSIEAVADLLCRDGRVPEWIDIRVDELRPDSTLLTFLCAGRYADTEPWLCRHPPDGTLIFDIPGIGWTDPEGTRRHGSRRNRAGWLLHLRRAWPCAR